MINWSVYWHDCPIYNVLGWVLCVQVISDLKCIRLVTYVQISLYQLHVGSVATPFSISVPINRPKKKNVEKIYFAIESLVS